MHPGLGGGGGRPAACEGMGSLDWGGGGGGQLHAKEWAPWVGGGGGVTSCMRRNGHPGLGGGGGGGGDSCMQRNGHPGLGGDQLHAKEWAPWVGGVTSCM